MKTASEKQACEQNSSFNFVLKEFENVAEDINFLEKCISLTLIEEMLKYLKVPTPIENTWESWEVQQLSAACMCVVCVCSVFGCVWVCLMCVVYVCMNKYGVCMWMSAAVYVRVSVRVSVRVL